MMLQIFQRLPKYVSPICHLRFSIFILETLKFEWQCSQYFELNPTCGNTVHHRKSDQNYFVLECRNSVQNGSATHSAL